MTLVPVLVFLALLILIGLYAKKDLNKAENFKKEYFIANRSLGGIVLAMTLVATYGSVSSFISGPGVAWNLGFGWVVFAAPQIITGFLLLGLIGKRLAIIGRKIEAYTIIDVIHYRYANKSLTLLLSIVLLIFFTAMVVGQFIGGAQIFTAITGLDYKLGLLIFASVTVIYTSSGFKAVVLTDTLCAFLMITGMITLGYVIIKDGGGLSNIMEVIRHTNVGEDGISANLKVTANGALPYSLLFSAWLLVGFYTVALPQSAVRALSYKSTSDLHMAMFVATVVCGALMIGMTLLGVLSRGVILELPENGTDAVIPILIATHMHPILAGITIIGPLAATMSTVSSLLISASSAVVSDIYSQLHDKKEDKKDKFSANSKFVTIFITSFIGFIAILLAMYPQDIVVWVNLFAFGGLESAFLWPLVLGLFWKKMNAGGSLLGIIFGLGLYTLCMATGFKFMAFHNIVIGTACGLIFSIIGSYIFPDTAKERLKIFFPHRI